MINTPDQFVGLPFLFELRTFIAVDLSFRLFIDESVNDLLDVMIIFSFCSFGKSCNGYSF